MKYQEEEMVNKKMYQRIQKLKKKGYGKFQIAKQLKLDPATARKYYQMSPDQYSDYLLKIQERQKLFEVYEKEILKVYRKNDNQRLNMAAVYDYLEERFVQLPSSEKSLRNFIHHLENVGKLQYQSKPREYQKVPELPFGKQMQLDFGVYRRKNQPTLYIFGTVLSASRFKYVALQEDPFTTLDVILHLLDCFDYFGGIPLEMVIDQDSLMVVNENYGDIIYTKKFSIFLEEMDLKMYVCRKADPESKGKIENVIKYVKYNFLQVRTFRDIYSAKESLAKWLYRRANGKISQATQKVPLLAIEEERKHLRSVKNSIYRKSSFLDRDKRTASEKSVIMVDSNEYSVPSVYRQKDVEIYKTDTVLYIFDERTGAEIAHHELSIGSGQRIIDKSHFRNKSCTVEELEQEIISMFDFDNWITFVKQTHKTYPRYFRDQCLLARKYFSSETEFPIFEMAVDYCLENSTYAMTALKDTYEYQLREHSEDQKTIQFAFSEVFKVAPYPELQISKRSLTEYEDLITSKAGGAV
jgi:transposase